MGWPKKQDKWADQSSTTTGQAATNVNIQEISDQVATTTGNEITTTNLRKSKHTMNNQVETTTGQEATITKLMTNQVDM